MDRDEPPATDTRPHILVPTPIDCGRETACVFVGELVLLLVIVNVCGLLAAKGLIAILAALSIDIAAPIASLRIELAPRCWSSGPTSSSSSEKGSQKLALSPPSAAASERHDDITDGEAARLLLSEGPLSDLYGTLLRDVMLCACVGLIVEEEAEGCSMVAGMIAWDRKMGGQGQGSVLIGVNVELEYTVLKSLFRLTGLMTEKEGPMSTKLTDGDRYQEKS